MLLRPTAIDPVTTGVVAGLSLGVPTREDSCSSHATLRHEGTRRNLEWLNTLYRSENAFWRGRRRETFDI